jgi:DNA processing protein
MNAAFSSLARDASAYPPLLRAAAGSPGLLYIEGDPGALLAPCLSVVGSRTMSEYGRAVLRRFIPVLVRAGLTIVSGLAYGVDGEAHRLALEQGGLCAAVLGCGLDITYPESHLSLRRAVVGNGGCILSEYPVGTRPFKSHFPERNRIVAGLSPVTLIVEAGERSGSLITARCALDAGREVCVVPADITRPQSAGILSLLRQGAVRPVSSPEEIILLYGSAASSQIALNLRPALTGSMATLYDLVSCGVETLEGLAESSGLRLAELQGVLTVLELDNYLQRIGNRWQRTS